MALNSVLVRSANTIGLKNTIQMLMSELNSQWNLVASKLLEDPGLNLTEMCHLVNLWYANSFMDSALLERSLEQRLKYFSSLTLSATVLNYLKLWSQLELNISWLRNYHGAVITSSRTQHLFGEASMAQKSWLISRPQIPIIPTESWKRFWWAILTLKTRAVQTNHYCSSEMVTAAVALNLSTSRGWSDSKTLRGFQKSSSLHAMNSSEISKNLLRIFKSGRVSSI